MRLAPIDDERDLSPDHQLGEVFLVGLGRRPLADDLSAPDDRDPVRDLEHLVQLVADEHDAVALGRQPTEDLEYLLGLLGCEDRSGLVENEDPCVAVERLEDLHALLPSDRQRADLGLRIDLEPEPPAELDDALVGLGTVEERSAGRLLAEDDVLGDGQDRDQHEVLVDHVDATGDRVGRPGQSDRLAVKQDLARVGRRQPVQDVHESGLAGAVLAEEGVDLARAHVKVDGIVGDDTRIALRDAAHLERRCVNCGDLRCHRCLVCAFTCRYATSGPACRSTRSFAGLPQLAGTMGSGAGVLPQAGAGGQVTTEPSFMPARAVSSWVWMSAGSLLAAS